jgi:hypothetical protein
VTAVDTLRRDLDNAPDTGDLLRTAWDALTLAAAGAHALAWQDGVDSVSALAAAAAAGVGRDLLPLPPTGIPPELPDDVGTTLTDALAEVLELLQQQLDQAARATDDPQLAFTLAAAADHCGQTAVLLGSLGQA